MTEDDTFNRLKSLSYEECVELYTYHYLNFFKSNPEKTRDDGWEYTDKFLRPYGWTCKKMERYGLNIYE